jgi:acyl-CoA reductase-like NAD-dependent aldehyde dehydrogenase
VVLQDQRQRLRREDRRHFTDTWVDMHTYTLKEPYSVVGLIFPWNGRIFNACAKLAPALAAGCSMIVKPAEEHHFRRYCWSA